MGSLYLVDLADVCRSSGWPVIEVDGWQQRARGSGGYSGLPSHVMAHHTASGPSGDGWPDVNYCTYGDDDAPLCNLYLSRVPEIYVCAAGATNTNGSGSDPCGLIGDDAMNATAIGIEAGNDGVGEPWNERQQQAYLDLVRALCAAYGIAPEQCHGHAEWTSRKVDPAGPSRWASGSATWNMSAFRADLGSSSPPLPPPLPIGDDDVSILLHARDGDDAQRSAVFWWDGRAIGWVRTGTAIDVGRVCGLYTTEPLDNFSVGELQVMIDSGWAGGPVPPGYREPAAIDSSVT